MNQKTKRVIAGGVAALVFIGGIGIGWIGVVGATGGDNDVPIAGTGLDKASAAALAHIGEGRVTDTEAGDEDGAYEVEITREDGRQVDVHLDENFNVLGQEADGTGPDDADASNDN